MLFNAKFPCIPHMLIGFHVPSCVHGKLAVKFMRLNWQVFLRNSLLLFLWVKLVYLRYYMSNYAFRFCLGFGQYEQCKIDLGQWGNRRKIQDSEWVRLYFSCFCFVSSRLRWPRISTSHFSPCLLSSFFYKKNYLFGCIGSSLWHLASSLHHGHLLLQCTDSLVTVCRLRSCTLGA